MKSSKHLRDGRGNTVLGQDNWSEEFDYISGAPVTLRSYFHLSKGDLPLFSLRGELWPLK